MITLRFSRQYLHFISWPLWLGAMLVAMLLFAALFPSLLTQADPSKAQVQQTPGGVSTGPFPPGTYGYVLGSDPYGRDLFAQLLTGARYTLAYCLLTAALRVTIGAVLGLCAGWFRGLFADLIGALAAAQSAVPALFVAWGPLSIANRLLGFEWSFAAWVVILGLVGWGETVLIVRAWTTALKPRPFIESARSVGRSELAILRHHVWPNVRGVLLVQVTFEMSAVLLTVSELGFFSLFLGGGVFDEVLKRAINVLPEWGAMLAESRNLLLVYPWVPLVPAMGFIIAIVGFNLLAEGLRHWLERRLI